MAKINDEGEVKRWYEEGKSYQWMVDEYARKYKIDITISSFSRLRAKRGWPRRNVRDPELVPWRMKDEHQADYRLTMLRLEARRRAGMPIAEKDARNLAAFRKRLDEKNAVVYYDPDTEQGFFLIPREPGDNEWIRQPPPEAMSSRGNADDR